MEHGCLLRLEILIEGTILGVSQDLRDAFLSL
jgi:hypothetical protein